MFIVMITEDFIILHFIFSNISKHKLQWQTKQEKQLQLY